MHRLLVFALWIALGAGCATFSRKPLTGAIATAPADTATQDELSQEFEQTQPATDAVGEPQRAVTESGPAAEPEPAIAEPATAPSPDLTVLTTPPIHAVKSSGYGWRDDPFRRKRKFHSGTDYSSDSGTPVAAAGGGVVSFAGRRRGYGNVVLIDHGGGVATLYGHLRTIEVATNAKVAAGDRIGQVGQTGRATGPHLHFEVHVNGRPVDPVMAMAVAEAERVSPEDAGQAVLALTSDAASKAKAESQHRARSKRGNHLRRGRGKRPQTLW